MFALAPLRRHQLVSAPQNRRFCCDTTNLHSVAFACWVSSVLNRPDAILPWKWTPEAEQSSPLSPAPPLFCHCHFVFLFDMHVICIMHIWSRALEPPPPPALLSALSLIFLIAAGISCYLVSSVFCVSVAHFVVHTEAEWDVPMQLKQENGFQWSLVVYLTSCVQCHFSTSRLFL